MFKRFKALFFDRDEVNFEVLRCYFCNRIITNFNIEKGILCRCGQNQWISTNPILWEKIMILVRYIIRGY